MFNQTSAVFMPLEIFTPDEILDIKDRILSLRQYWKWWSYGKADTDFGGYMLPPGLYATEGYQTPGSKYQKHLGKDLSLRALMEENFSVYYLKVKDEISNILQTEAQMNPHHNYPGFHIYEGPLEHNYLNLHRDRWTTINDPVWSVLIPICLPESGCGVIYANTLDAIEIRNRYRVADDIKYTRARYEVSKMAGWYSEMPHSADHFTLKENEYRITMQFHVMPESQGISEIFW